MPIRPAFLFVLMTMLAAGEAPPVDDIVNLFTPCFERAIAAGMPDVRGATFWQGTWKHEPERSQHPPQLLGFHHLHLRLADGRWLMRGIYLRPTAESATMLKPGFAAIDPAAAGVVKPTTWKPGKNDNSLLDCDHWLGDDGLLALARFAGLVQAGDSSLLHYGMPGRQRSWNEAGRLYLPGGDDEQANRDRESDSEHIGRITPEEAARRALHLVLVAQALHAGHASEVRTFTTAALALMSADERPFREPLVAPLAELPGETAPTLATPALEHLVREWGGWLANGQVHHGGQSEEYDIYGVPVLWTANQIDGLVALVGDPRPSRWLDDARPRSIGDNALRALAWRWGVDPRLLVGRDPRAPWTVEERAATAQALQAWWKPWHGKSLTNAIATDPALTPMLWTTRAIYALDPGDRATATTAVFSAWRRFDQAGRDALPPFLVEDVLGQLGDDERLDTLVRTWPVAGPLRRSLALWHEVRGNHQPLTAHLRGLLTGSQCSQADVAALHRVTVLDPDQERLDLLLFALRADPGSDAFKVAQSVVYFGRRGSAVGECTPLITHRFERNAGFHGRASLISALVLVGLWDERPLAFGQAHTLQQSAAQDLRLCDEVVAMRAGDELENILRVSETATPVFDVNRPKAERDVILARCRERMLPLVASHLASTGLRMPHPGGGEWGAPFPTWWQAELDAARAQNKAVALLITNTKTCVPCVDLEREVLSQPAWRTWADAHLRLVVLDGGLHVDEPAYWQRMNDMIHIYDGAGTPSFILVANNGRRLSRCYDYEKGGPAWYIAEFERALAGKP